MARARRHHTLRLPRQSPGLQGRRAEGGVANFYIVVSCGVCRPADSHANTLVFLTSAEGQLTDRAKACLHVRPGARHTAPAQVHITGAHASASSAASARAGTHCWPAGHGPAGRLRVHRHIRRRLQAGARLLGKRLSDHRCIKEACLHQSSRLSSVCYAWKAHVSYRPASAGACIT